MLVQIRDINSNDIINFQQISEDAGEYQQDVLAAKMMQKTTFAYQDMYAAIVDTSTGDAVRKFQLDNPADYYSIT